MTEREVDDVTGTQTTGHEWDGIKELNTPLPRWWLWTFYGTIIFAIGYTIAFPAWPLISSATTGILGYSSRADHDAEVANARVAQGEVVEKIASLPVADILSDETLARFARAAGRSLFKVNCAQCHGTGAAGSPGYPNLNDDEWIWGGSIEEIEKTIANGARSPVDPDTRFTLMPNFGTEALLSRDEIATVARQVASFSGIEGGAATPEGAQLFTDNCSSCHGETGAGVAELGGPSLNDRVWLYGDTLEAIRGQITAPRHGVMPAWLGRLDESEIKELAAYVHGLGGGQ